MEIRKQTDEAMQRARGVIQEAHEDLHRIFGRGGDDPFIEEYMTDDAEIVLMGMGTLNMPLRVTVRRLREQGRKVGFVRVRWFRPFPAPELQKCLSRFKAVGVIDRDYSLGSPNNGGVLYTDVRSALYNLEKRVPLAGFICGLGGREVTIHDTINMFDKVQGLADTGHLDKEVQWIGVRE
jgi:pyruvate ferredoxin oxidoreductase alpha subunit